MRRVLWLQASAFALVVVALSANVWQVGENRRLARQGHQAHLALCVFRADLAGRVGATATFLRNHPNGIAGVNANEIAQSLSGQQATLDSLRLLRCP